jgi:hypothetical protein
MESPYDKAAAIASFLRQEIAYSPSVPAPPPGRDPVVWVLFVHKRGFCNYYASAQVLLLRSIGIPARLAVGFAQGGFEDGAYAVHERNAHAWPEVYFPGIGWVEFEPTSNQSALVRPSGLLTVGGAFVAPSPPRPLVEERDRSPEEVEIAPPGTPLPFWLTPFGRALRTAIPILVALMVIALMRRYHVMRRAPALLLQNLEAGGAVAPTWLRQWEHWNRLGPVERAFGSVSWTLRLLGLPQPTNATPAVQAATLIRVLPRAARHIDVLREELETGLYSPYPPNPVRARRASLVVLVHGLRARLGMAMALLDGRAVYYRR